MTEVVKIDGSPGGGKSYTLEKRLQVEKDNGLEVFDFWWLNFTTSGRRDVEPALNEMWPDPAPDVEGADRAKTIHGLALSLCVREGVIDLGEDGDDRIIQQGQSGENEKNHFADFCEQRAIPYSPEAATNQSILAGEADAETTGNRLFAVNDYLRQTYKPPAAWRDAPVDMRIAGGTVKRLLEEWDEYKRTHKPRLYEHGDYVQVAIDESLVPDVEVLLIDEFQDLAPIEYKLYKQWRDSGRLDRIYISGDPNQSVYSFRGGTPVYFEETDRDETITLKESYRCPQKIASVARAILDAHQETDARGFEGKESGGIVESQRFHDKEELRNRVLSMVGQTDETPAVMLLTRTNRQLSMLTSDLRNAGVPFQTLGSRGGAWSTAMKHIYNVLSNFGTVDEYTRSEVRELFKALPDGHERRQEMEGGGTAYNAGVVEAVLDDFDGVVEIAESLRFGDGGAWRRDVLQNALDAPGDLSPADVQAGTIHNAKGLESPTVMLFTNTTRTMNRRYRRREADAAEEHRVYYVGATRASERLVLVDDYFGGPIAQPIERVRSQGAV